MTSQDSNKPSPPNRPVTRRRQLEVALALPPVRPPEDVNIDTIARYLEDVADRSRLIPLR